jgi:hypothetical protein
MHDLLPAVERNAREISQIAARALGVLAAAESMPGPTLYLKAMRNVADLRQVWVEHRELLSQAYPPFLPDDDSSSLFLRQFEQDVTDTGRWLETLAAAGWPRNPEIGVNAIRVRVTQTLTTILRQMERERTTIVPLLRRARKAAPVEVIKLMATA